jgi:hypothetical protein
LDPTLRAQAIDELIRVAKRHARPVVEWWWTDVKCRGDGIVAEIEVTDRAPPSHAPSWNERLPREDALDGLDLTRRLRVAAVALHHVVGKEVSVAPVTQRLHRVVE